MSVPFCFCLFVTYHTVLVFFCHGPPRERPPRFGCAGTLKMRGLLGVDPPAGARGEHGRSAYLQDSRTQGLLVHSFV